MTEMARHWIDGRWLESELVTDSRNPATGELLGRFADGGEGEARAAVDAARRAFAVTDWGRATVRCVRAHCWNSPSYSKRGPRNWL
jgi:acyl-CoA reductase-like NAD-dependent aldehyde dehydrogenase